MRPVAACTTGTGTNQKFGQRSLLCLAPRLELLSGKIGQKYIQRICPTSDRAEPCRQPHSVLPASGRAGGIRRVEELSQVLAITKSACTPVA